MTQRAIETKLRELVRHVAGDAKIYFPRKRGWQLGYSWNGRHLRPTGLTLESQIHEIAHLLLAPPSRRDQPEFGLGPDPYKRNHVPLTVPQGEADREELDACALQLLLVRLLGLDEAAMMCEFHTAPLTIERVQDLRARYPAALPEAWWQRGVDSLVAGMNAAEISAGDA